MFTELLHRIKYFFTKEENRIIWCGYRGSLKNHHINENHIDEIFHEKNGSFLHIVTCLTEEKFCKVEEVRYPQEVNFF